MNLVKLNPWREMDVFSNRFNRFFDGSCLPTTRFGDDGLRNWSPAVDIYDNDEKITIKAELPGVDKDNIHVDVKDGVLTLTGERSYDNEIKEENYHRKETFSGKFYRSFALTDGLNPEKIAANYKDGILKIEVPRAEEKKPKKIDIH